MQESHRTAAPKQPVTLSYPQSAASRRPGSLPPSPFRLRPSRRAFTLTELLVVIAIIAILAGLIAAAAVNAMKSARRSQVVLEMKTMSTAIEDFKNDYNAYPPNGMNPSPGSGPIATLVQGDFTRMFKKAFPKHQEPPALIRALCGQNTGGPADQNLPNGLTASEAIYFWLGGFSADEKYPISGSGGPSFSTSSGPGEVLEDRQKRYEFDLSRLGPRDDDDLFSGRFIEYPITINGVNDTRRINFWRYNPKGSEQPYVYFDVSRRKPGQYDAWAANTSAPTNAPPIFAFKQLREGVASGATGTAGEMSVFVNQGKYQFLHAGLDDDWGPEFAQMQVTSPTVQVQTLLLYPDGPFIGPIADTLTNFSDGELADASEQ